MKIAIIGNGAGSLKRSNGQIIDTCDLVIRINDYRTAGFEAAVGSRTDIHMLNSWKKVPALEGALASSSCKISFAFPHPSEWLVAERFRSPYERDYLSSWKDSLIEEERNLDAHEAAVRRHLPDREITYFGINYMTWLVDELGFERAGILLGRNGELVQPTTGVKAIWLARAVHPAAELKITGFDGFQTSSYYWDPNTPDQYDNHAYQTEIKWIDELRRKEILERLD